MSIQAITDLYNNFYSELSQNRKKRSLFSGAFGFKDTQQIIITDKFQTQLQALLETLDSNQIEEALLFIFEEPNNHKDSPTIYWTLIGVQSFTLNLIDKLTHTQAENLLQTFTALYPPKDRFPTQKKIYQALKNRLPN